MYTGEKVSTFRDRFCELANATGKTTVEVAKDLHVSNQTVSAWRIGVRSPKEPTIIAIADHFNVNVPWLMGFDVEKEKENRSVIIADSDLFKKILTHMSTSDYNTVVSILEKTELEMREKGLL